MTTVMTVIAPILAAIVAITVPAVAFRFTLTQERQRWLREQRANLYIDLLAEAHAEKQWFFDSMFSTNRREDIRLGPHDRAKLGARSTVYATVEINRKFNKIASIILQHEFGIDGLGNSPADRQAVKREVERAFDDLDEAIRHELGHETGVTTAGPRWLPRRIRGRDQRL